MQSAPAYFEAGPEDALCSAASPPSCIRYISAVSAVGTSSTVDVAGALLGSGAMSSRTGMGFCGSGKNARLPPFFLAALLRFEARWSCRFVAAESLHAKCELCIRCKKTSSPKHTTSWQTQGRGNSPLHHCLSLHLHSTGKRIAAALLSDA